MTVAKVFFRSTSYQQLSVCCMQRTHHLPHEHEEEDAGCHQSSARRRGQHAQHGKNWKETHTYAKTVDVVAQPATVSPKHPY